MDFSKAFDEVSHRKLAYKIDQIVKNSQIYNWISAYLTNREQFVVFGDHCSNRQLVDSGVPQGSVLGPLPFLPYMNDIVDDIPVKIKLYARDCDLYKKVCCFSGQDMLNIALQKVASWCDQWQMAINFEKRCLFKSLIKIH